MEIARLYRDAQRSFVELAMTFTDVEWSTPVPCTPGWTVHDVVSHVAGVTDDVTNGRVEGAATEPWTAAQVERWRHTPRAQLIDQWDAQVDVVADAFEALAEPRPPIDCHTHEHDVRHAIGRPGERDSEIIRTIVELAESDWHRRPITITFDDGSTSTTDGTGEPITLTGVSRFDVARSRLGRRSLSQVQSWAWSEPLSADDLDAWFVFGPAESNIVE